MQVSKLNIVPGLDPNKRYRELEAELEAEYQKMNYGQLSTMKTDELQKLMSKHFQNATAMMSQAGILLKHVSIISKIIGDRTGKGL